MQVATRGGAVLSTLAVTAALGAGCGAPPGFGEELAGYDFEKAHVVKLADGGRLAVGSRTGHDVTVQWRDPDGDTWSPPQEVARFPEHWTHDLQVEVGESTVAIAPDFWVEEKLDDDYAPAFTALVVCQPRTCSEPQRADGLSSAHVADDGQLVFFGLGARSVLFWDDGAFRTEKISGLPDDGRVEPLPDGSVLAVASRKVGQDCHYDLYAASRGTVAFTRVAEGPGYPEKCDAYGPEIDEDDPDVVRVYVNSAPEDLRFVREDGRWRADVPAVRPIAYADTRGRRTIAPVELADRSILVGSPDTVRIMASVRADGTDWEEPREIARAPEGTRCRFATPAHGPGESTLHLVQVNCYPPGPFGTDAEISPSLALVLVTRDGGHSWQEHQVSDPTWEPMAYVPGVVLVTGAERTLVFRDDTPAVVTARLPVRPTWDSVLPVEGGRRLLRLIGNAHADALCRPGWTMGTATATRWPEPTRLTGAPLRDLQRGRCSWSIEEYDGGGRVGVRVSGGDFETGGTLVRRGDAWVFEPWGEE